MEGMSIDAPIASPRFNMLSTACCGRGRFKACRDFGLRAQFSVFEIEVDPAQWATPEAKRERLIKPVHDGLRYYYLGANWTRLVERVGANPATDLGGPLIVWVCGARSRLRKPQA
jgi:CRISPR-associated protein Cas2